MRAGWTRYEAPRECYVDATGQYAIQQYDDGLWRAYDRQILGALGAEGFLGRWTDGRVGRALHLPIATWDTADDAARDLDEFVAHLAEVA